MEEILQALGGILLRAIPTVILLILVHFYLKRMLFRPLEQTLAKRREQTDGAQEAARASLARAEEKAAMYELALKEALARSPGIPNRRSPAPYSRTHSTSQRKNRPGNRSR